MRKFLVCATSIVLSLVFAACADLSASNEIGYDDSVFSPSEPQLEQHELPKNFHGISGGSGNGCLELTVPDRDESFYVKLKKGEETVWDAFMHPGSNFKFAVPTGTYDLVYGAGENWYGWDNSFGPEGAYSETTERFNFERSGCWQVKLILQPGGNLGRTGLNYEDF